jgi:ribosome maturation factor RimP
MRATGLSATMSAPEARIVALIEPTVEGLGYALVRVRISGGRRPVLQVMAERRADGQMSVDDCTSLSRALSALLDVEDPIGSEYLLEVSSPGIDRPLVKAADFRRFAGQVARLETVRPLDGRRRFTGRLLGLSEAGELVRIEVDGAACEIALGDIAQAKLVLTDELIAASLKQPTASDGGKRDA